MFKIIYTPLCAIFLAQILSPFDINTVINIILTASVIVGGFFYVKRAGKKELQDLLEKSLASWRSIADAREETIKTMKNEYEEKVTNLEDRFTALSNETSLIRKENADLRSLNLTLQRENIELHREISALRVKVENIDRDARLGTTYPPRNLPPLDQNP